MNLTFDHLHRQVASATLALLKIMLGSFGVTLLCAVLGFAQGVSSFRSATLSLAWAFGAFLLVFVISSLAGALIRRRGTL
jgi:hypothetical protein